MKIKSSKYFTLMLTDNGDVYSWGNNKYGQLGTGCRCDSYCDPSKVFFPLNIPIKYISAGDDHAAAVDHNYNVYIWGLNSDGQLGLGNYENKMAPTLVDFFTGKKVKKIYCAGNNTYALTSEGKVYGWGLNYKGILGLGHDNIVDVPYLLNFPDNASIKKLYCGKKYTFAIDTKSNVYSWGSNKRYQLCNGTEGNWYIPSVANMLKDYNVKKILCSKYNCIILAYNKSGDLSNIAKLYFIGIDEYEMFDTHHGPYKKLFLLNVDTDETIDDVFVYEDAIFCKMTSGSIYSWGNNKYGRLGIGNTINQYIPQKVNIPPNIILNKIICARDTTYATTTTGEIYSWGFDELGYDDENLNPTIVTYFDNNNINIKSRMCMKSARNI